MQGKIQKSRVRWIIMGNNESCTKVKYDPVMTPVFTLLGLGILGATALLTIAGIYYTFISPSF